MPSIWKKVFSWLASVASLRKHLPGKMARRGAPYFFMMAFWAAEVWVFSSRVIFHGEAHGGEDLLQLALHHGDGMVGALGLVDGQGHVVLLGGGDEQVLLSGLQGLGLGGQALLHLFFQGVDVLPQLPLFLGAHVLEALEQLGDTALFAQIAHPELLHGLTILSVGLLSRSFLGKKKIRPGVSTFQGAKSKNIRGTTQVQRGSSRPHCWL